LLEQKVSPLMLVLLRRCVLQDVAAALQLQDNQDNDSASLEVRMLAGRSLPNEC
jgi:hypothetical protein